MENENFYEEICDCKAKQFYEKFKDILEPLLEVETEKSSDSSQDIQSIFEMIYKFEKTPQEQKDNSEDEKDRRHQENLSSTGSKEDVSDNIWQHSNEDFQDHLGPVNQDQGFLHRNNPLSISSTRTIRLKKKKLETPSNISLSSRDDILEKIRMNPRKTQSQFLYEFLNWYKDTKEQKDDDSDDSLNPVKEEIILKLMDKYGDLLSFKSSTNSIENFENYPDSPDKNPDLENALKEIEELKNALQEIEKIAGPIKISRKGKYLIKVTRPKSEGSGSGKSPRKSPKKRSNDEKELGKVDLLESDSESEESDEIVINLENLDQGDSHKDLSVPGPSGAQKTLQDDLKANKDDSKGSKKGIKENSKDSFKDYFEIDSKEKIQRGNKDDFLPSVFQDNDLNPRGSPLPEALHKKIFSGFDLEKTQYIDPEPIPIHFFEEPSYKKDEKDEILAKNEKSILDKELQLTKLEKKLRKFTVKKFITDQTKKGQFSGRKKSSTKSLLKFPENIIKRTQSLPDISRTSNVNEIYRIGLEDCHYPKHQFFKRRTSDSNLRGSCESCFKDSNMSLVKNSRWSRKYKVDSVDLDRIHQKRTIPKPSGSSRITDISPRTHEVDFLNDLEFDNYEDEYSNYFRNELLFEIEKIIENAHSEVIRRSHLLTETNLYHFQKLNRWQVDTSALSPIELGALSVFQNKNSLESLCQDTLKNFVMPSLSKYLKDSERHENCGCPSVNGADSFWNKNEKNHDEISVNSVKISTRSENSSGSTNNDYTLSCMKSDQEILKEYMDSVRSSDDPEPEELKKKEKKDSCKNDTKRMKDAKIYLEEHKIQDLCYFLNTHLLTFLPDEPVQFLIELLDKCLKYRTFGSSEVLEPPLLFQRRHIESLFKSMAPHNRKYISYKQYKIGMLTLNIKNYNTTPEMTSQGCISRDTFVKEALMTMTKNFADIIRPSETKRQFCTKTVSTDSLQGFFSFKNFSSESSSTFLTGPSNFTMD